MAQLFSLGHFTMRYTILIPFVTATFLLGCRERSQVETQTTAPPVTSQPTFKPTIVSSFGSSTNIVTDGSWQIAVSEGALQLSCSGSSVGFPAWNAHTGWFVFIESDSRVWAYDGVHPLWLSTVTESGNNVAWKNFNSPKFPCAVPSEVFSRLPASAQKAISPND